MKTTGLFGQDQIERTSGFVFMQEQVLAEASMMIPDTRQRLETALADLQQFLVIMSVLWID